MTVGDILGAVRQFWATLLLSVLIALAVAVGLFITTKPTYSSTSQLFVSTVGQSTVTDQLQGSSFAQQRVKSYAPVVTSPLVLNPVIKELDLNTDSDSLAGHISAAVPLNTVLINISATSGDAVRASELANAVAKSFQQVIVDLESTDTDGGASVKVEVIKPAVAASAPVSPKLPVNLAAGLALGTLIGVGLCVLRDVMDVAVRSVADVKATTDASVIGEIGLMKDMESGTLAMEQESGSPLVEAFRQIRTNLMFVNRGDRSGVYIVTSCLPAEGKTTVVTNLAMAFATTGQRVCLVDADLRRPRVAEYLGMEGAAGLTTALIGEAPLRDVIQRWGDEFPFWVLPSGLIPPNPSELLGSQAMEDAIKLLTEKFDVILLDAPPLLPVSDAAILASIFKNVVLVTSCRRVTKPQLNQSIEKLQAVDIKPAGIIVNRVTKKVRGGYNDYGYDTRPTDHESLTRARNAPGKGGGSGRKGKGREYSHAG